MKTYEVTDMAPGWLNVRTPIDYRERVYQYDLPVNSPVKDNQFIATQFFTLPIYCAINEEYWHHPDFKELEWYKSPQQIRMSLSDGDDNFECIVSSDLHHQLYECDSPLSQNMEVRGMIVEDIFWEIKTYFDQANDENGCAPEFIAKVQKFFGSKSTSDFKNGFLSPDVAVHSDGTGFDT